MKEIFLSFSEISAVQQLHDYLSEKLSFPDYYGKNLDALYDCLNEIAEPTTIFISLSKPLEPYIDRTLRVFMDSSFANDNLLIQFIN